VALPRPEQIWKDCCEASVDIRARYGLKASIDYLVGDKLMMFAQTGERSPEFLAELPAFSKRIRKLFTNAQIEEHFERAAQASEVEPDIFKGATAEEAEQLREALEDDRRKQQLRDWVKTMLLRSGS
jgi:hypothetical protein